MKTAQPPAPGEAPEGGESQDFVRDFKLRLPASLPDDEARSLVGRTEHLASALAKHVNHSSFRQLAAAIERLQELAVTASKSDDPRVIEWLVEQVDSLSTPVVPADVRWNELVGPFYDTAGLERWLGVSRQALSQRVKAGELLGLLAKSRRTTYYPVWQFNGRDLVRGVPEVIRGLGERSALNKALWLKSQREEFGDHTVIEVLANGDPSDVRAIIAEARADGTAWAH